MNGSSQCTTTKRTSKLNSSPAKTSGAEINKGFVDMDYDVDTPQVDRANDCVTEHFINVKNTG